jgi:hypothetical protein
MKIVLGIVGVLGGAVIVILALASAKPDAMHVEKGVTTSAPPATVLAILNDLHRFPEWSPWQKLDPNMKTTYGGPATGVGSSYAWEGNDKAGKGQMTITQSGPEGITMALEFKEPFPSTADIKLGVAPEGAGSKVTWGFDSPNSFGTKIFTVFANMEEMLGKDFDEGLSNLKALAEKEPKPVPPAPPVEAAPVDAGP